MLWGVASGTVVSCGYFGYFLGSKVLPAALAFALSGCNPLVGLVLNQAWHWRKWVPSVPIEGGAQQAPLSARKRGLIFATLVLYGAAIGVLAVAH